MTANGLRINKTDEWSAAGPEASCRILVDHLGSATSDRFRPGRSDVDVLVEFAGLLGRPVDLVMADAVRNPHFAASVLAGAEELYAAWVGGLLRDVREAGSRITKFTEGLTGESFAADELRKSAVERQPEIIGEALNRLRKADPETAQRVPEISRIVGLRNILAHGYAVVDDTVVWSAVSERIPALLADVTELLAEIE